MNRQVGDVCVERIRAGAVFAANLIGGAWQTAGAPTFSAGSATVALEKAPAETATPSDQPADTDADSPFIGSKNSNVFHRRNCKFARQISKENYVFFKSAKHAHEQGRRGCKFCKPD